MEPCNDSVIHKPNVKINAQKWVLCAVPLTVLRFLIVGQVYTKGDFLLLNTRLRTEKEQQLGSLPTAH
ncbi:hypothetical protein T09_4841 [Trichinella sp. T9]|nr:hypothetical protein T09_4841 [Trichinella sp. T9]